MPAPITLRLVPGRFAVCQFAPDAPFPAWAAANTSAFTSITRTADELSIVAAEAVVPEGVRGERDWALLKFEGPFDFGAVGILASVATPLATAGISLLAIGTFDTDYVLIKQARLDDARRVLESAGHRMLAS